MLTHPASRLARLYMAISSSSAIALFTVLGLVNKLQLLDISQNLITDVACDVIAASLTNNTSLVTLCIHVNMISPKAMQDLV